LATVLGIVQQNHGFVRVTSEPNRGTAFHLYLPRYHGEADRVEPQAPEEHPGGAHETILLVEDEPAILRLAKRTLESLGYRVLAALTPGEAIRAAEAFGGEIDLLLTDVVMPEMMGRELAERLQVRYPQIRRLFMSGYTADVIACHGVVDPNVHFLEKPFTIRTLADQVRAALEG
jgi:CheY-like chemotaxis protein